MLTASKKPSFLRTLLGDHRVAAVSPSSPFLMRRLVRALRPETLKLVVELGPGSGVAAAAILPHLAADARYLAVERNPQFAAALRLHADPRETVIEGVAQDLERLFPEAIGHADAVIASIPFVYLSPEERRTVTLAAKKMLRPGGAFIVFHQYTLLMPSVMKAEFGNVAVQFEPLNVFPCFLMRAEKR